MKSVRAKPELPRWPLHGAHEVPSTAARLLGRAEWIAAGLWLISLGAPLSLALHAVLIVVIVAVLLVAIALRRRVRARSVAGWIVLDDEGLARERGSEITRLASWGARFGVAVLSNEARDLGVLAITTESATRYVPVRATRTGMGTQNEELAVARELFAAPAALTEMDVRYITRDDAAALSPVDATNVVAAIRAREPGALARLVLSDPRGALVVLEGDQLRAGDRVIDLAAPLEWRAFLFVESSGAVASVIQATWVRQAGVEVVLVADAAREPSHPRGGRVSHPDAPPPLEHRIAIERLFMAPVRLALDRAPRASRAPPPLATAQHRAPT